MKKILILLMIALSLIGCKKRVDYEAEQAQMIQAQNSEESALWKIQTPQGTQVGHKVDILSNGSITFVNEESHRVYVNGNFTAEKITN